MHGKLTATLTALTTRCMKNWQLPSPHWLHVEWKIDSYLHHTDYSLHKKLTATPHIGHWLQYPPASALQKYLLQHSFFCGHCICMIKHTGVFYIYTVEKHYWNCGDLAIHDHRMLLDGTLGSHSTLGSLTQDSMISCQASPVDDLNIKYMYYYIHCKKRLAISLSPAGMSLTRLSIYSGE